jgi:hypothetical protein
MYDNPNRIKYPRFFDAGNNGNETWTIRGPKGKAGRLYDYGVEQVTEAFVADCTLAIGSGSDPDAYGEELAFGALAADDVLSVRSQYDPIANKAAFDALMVNPAIPKDTEVVMTLIDDTTSGIGTFFCIIDWDD